MKDYKIRIPCEVVSRLVQEKAFSEGYYWVHSKQEKAILPSIPYLFLKENGRITYVGACGSDYFNKKDTPEISWQEYLYGDGWFFKAGNDDDIYFQAKKDNRVYWVDELDAIASTAYANYGPEHYKSWIPCDMHGNILTIKQESNTMKQELNYTIPWKVKYNSEAELDAMRAVFKGLGCELHKDLECRSWNFVCCGGELKFLAQCTHSNTLPTVDLLTAITHLLTPVKSQEQLDSERKIAELEATINKAQLEVEKASQQIRELKGK